MRYPAFILEVFRMKFYDKYIKHIQKIPKLSRVLLCITAVCFVCFNYLLNEVSATTSDIIGYGFLAYCIICAIYFIIRREWLMFVIHLMTVLVSAYSIWWFLFV